MREQCDDLVEIPMVGQKESFNVSVANGIALYALTER
jgi:tRNA G18 (ribose-2'-O)-methylase SpoU